MSGRIKFDGPAPFEILREYEIPGRPEKEHNDCAPNAIALALGIPYITVHESLAALGRKKRRGTRDVVWRQYMRLQVKAGRLVDNTPKRVDYERNAEGKLERCYYPAVTLGQFVRKRPPGRYIVGIRHHMLAVIDGSVVDWIKPRWKAAIGALFRVIP